MNTKQKNAARKTGASNRAAGKSSKGASEAYGDKTPICMNTDCTLRKKAGGCFGFEGCPGFKSR
jgi:hypothetical protein